MLLRKSIDITNEANGVLLELKNLRLNKVTKEDNWINLTLKRGEVHAVMGEAGAGKTGIAHVLGGLTKLDNGAVYIRGNSVSIKNPAHSIALGIGVLLAETRYIPYMTVKEYLYLWGNTFIVSWSDLTRRALELLKKYEIDIDPNELLINLSQEEHREISLLKVIARQPDILVLDEPAVDVSEHRKSHLFRVVRKYAENGRGVLYLSNQLEEILQVGDRVTILKNGGTLASFPIDYAKKYPEKVLGHYLGRGDRGQPSDDEFKEMVSTLLQTSELLTSEYELQDLLVLMMEKIVDVVKADACRVLLLDEESKNVVEDFSHSRSGAVVAELKSEIIRRVISSGKPFVANYVTESSAAFKRWAGVRSFACVPIRLRSRISGTVQLFFSEKHEISQEEQELLMAFATQVAIAIENTRLLGRSTLLKEAHHRIKNNLQSIVSLLLLQLKTQTTKDLDAIVTEIIDRIKTIAAIHEILSQDEKSTGLINFRNLVTMIAANYNEKDNLGRIHLSLNVMDLFMSYKTATSLGLIVNELMANCFEHAFPGQQQGRIDVSLRQDDQQVHLQVYDNGVGINDEVLGTKGKTLGLTLVKTLVSRDLRGTLDITSENGTTVRISFSRKYLAS